VSARRGLALAFAAGVWIVAIVLLWRTRVPSGLDVSGVDVHRYFSDAELRRSDRYGRVGLLLFLASQLTLVLVLAGYARWGARLTRESAAGRIGTGMMLGMLGLAFVWLAELPFTVLQLWWERRHGLLKVDYFSGIFGGWLALGGEFLSICLALVIVMGFAKWLGERWWLAGAPAFVGIALLFAFLNPYLLQTRPLHDPNLAAAALRFERAEGVPRTPVRVEEVRTFTSAPNAEATGLGVSRRVILWDTLTDGRFSPAEIRFVLAHEIGHLARDHIWKSVAWYALFAFPGAFLIARLTRRRGRGNGRPSSRPSLALRTRRPQLARAAGAERDHAAPRGRGRLDGASDDPRSRGGTQALPPVHDDHARRAQPLDVRVPVAGEPPDDRPADSDGECVGGPAATPLIGRSGHVGGPVAVQRQVQAG